MAGVPPISSSNGINTGVKLTEGSNNVINQIRTDKASIEKTIPPQATISTHTMIQQTAVSKNPIGIGSKVDIRA